MCAAVQVVILGHTLILAQAFPLAGTSLSGGTLASLVAGGATFGVGQFALGFVPWPWLRLLIILPFVAPATVVGYSELRPAAAGERHR